MDAEIQDNIQKKNLVFIHLESISNLILWQYRVEMRTVWDLMKQSRYFTRFYTASTSTEMSTSDIHFGTSAFFDHLARFGKADPHPYSDTYAYIFTYLRHDFNYKYASGMCNYFGRPSEKNIPDYYYQIVDQNQEKVIGGCRKILADYKAKNYPFFFQLNNNVTHMAFDDDVKQNAQTFGDRFRIAYQQLDAFIKRALDMLAELDLIKDSIIVLYGDHGDEFWSHGLNRGYCHSTTPYAPLVSTPLLIYDNGENAGFDDRLMSATDVRETIIDTLFPGFVPQANDTVNRPFDAVPFSGRNINEKSRELAFSQNLFALQLEYADLEKALKKGYSVTDGVYRLVASSGGRKPKDGGLEFYHDRLDPANSRNLLDFFLLGGSGNILSFRPPPEAETSPDFLLAFNPDAIRNMIAAYGRLKKELYEYVRAKEAAALKFSGPECHIMPESTFRHARKRINKDYDE